MWRSVTVFAVSPSSADSDPSDVFADSAVSATAVVSVSPVVLLESAVPAPSAVPAVSTVPAAYAVPSSSAASSGFAVQYDSSFHGFSSSSRPIAFILPYFPEFLNTLKDRPVQRWKNCRSPQRHGSFFLFFSISQLWQYILWPIQNHQIRLLICEVLLMVDYNQISSIKKLDIVGKYL